MAMLPVAIEEDFSITQRKLFLIDGIPTPLLQLEIKSMQIAAIMLSIVPRVCEAGLTGVTRQFGPANCGCPRMGVLEEDAGLE